MARPVGASHGARDHWRVTFIAAASISTTAALSSRFTYSLPSPAATPNSGPPPRSIVPIARPDAGSITLADCAIHPASPRAIGTIDLGRGPGSEGHTSELQSPPHVVCRVLLEQKII